MGIRHSLLGWSHRLCDADVPRLSQVDQCQSVSHSHGRWHSKEDPILEQLCLLLLLAQLGHWAPALARGLQKASSGDLQWPLPAHSLSRQGHCASSSSRTFSGRYCHWPVSLVCPSAERFGLEKQKTGNSEQSRDVVWSQMCSWVLQRKHFPFELSALSVAWHNILSSF